MTHAYTALRRSLDTLETPPTPRRPSRFRALTLAPWAELIITVTCAVVGLCA